MQISQYKIFSQIKTFFKITSPPAPVVLSPQLDAYLVSQMIGAAIVSKQPFLVSRLQISGKELASAIQARFGLLPEWRGATTSSRKTEGENELSFQFMAINFWRSVYCELRWSLSRSEIGSQSGDSNPNLLAILIAVCLSLNRHAQCEFRPQGWTLKLDSGVTNWWQANAWDYEKIKFAKI